MCVYLKKYVQIMCESNKKCANVKFEYILIKCEKSEIRNRKEMFCTNKLF